MPPRLCRARILSLHTPKGIFYLNSSRRATLPQPFISQQSPHPPSKSLFTAFFTISFHLFPGVFPPFHWQWKSFPPATACFHRSLWIVEGEVLKAASFPPISPHSLHHIPPAVETSDCFSLLHFSPQFFQMWKILIFQAAKPTCPILHISTGPTITTILYLFFLYRKESKQK